MSPKNLEQKYSKMTKLESKEAHQLRAGWKYKKLEKRTFSTAPYCIKFISAIRIAMGAIQSEI
jgi:hypothetical protein